MTKKGRLARQLARRLSKTPREARQVMPDLNINPKRSVGFDRIRLKNRKSK